MGLLGSSTVVAARTGRKTNNALTLTYKTSESDTLAIAVQKGSAGVLFGFKNGGSGRYTISSDGKDESIVVDCSPKRTTASGGSGRPFGWIEKDESGDGVLSTADGVPVARVAGHPKDRAKEAVWPYRLNDASGGALGTYTWVRTGTKFDLAGELVELSVWWDRAGGPLKVPSLGVQLELGHPVDPVLGDLLLAMGVDISLGSHSFIRA
jgi:hypothetical protein